MQHDLDPRRLQLTSEKLWHTFIQSAPDLDVEMEYIYFAGSAPPITQVEVEDVDVEESSDVENEGRIIVELEVNKSNPLDGILDHFSSSDLDAETSAMVKLVKEMNVYEEKEKTETLQVEPKSADAELKDVDVAPKAGPSGPVIIKHKMLSNYEMKWTEAEDGGAILEWKYKTIEKEVRVRVGGQVKVSTSVDTGERYSCDLCGSIVLKTSLFRHISTTHFGKPQIRKKSATGGKIHTGNITVTSGIGENLQAAGNSDISDFRAGQEKLDTGKKLETEVKKPVGNVVNPVNCGICRMKLPRKSLGKHLRGVHSLESKSNKTCIVCHETCATIAFLKTHLKSHPITIQRPYSCFECPQSFNTIIQLNDHMAVHSKTPKKGRSQSHDGRHICKKCGLILPTKARLKVHVLTHSKIHKGFKCESCDRAFSLQIYLKRHVREKHTK